MASRTLDGSVISGTGTISSALIDLRNVSTPHIGIIITGSLGGGVCRVLCGDGVNMERYTEVNASNGAVVGNDINLGINITHNLIIVADFIQIECTGATAASIVYLIYRAARSRH